MITHITESDFDAEVTQSKGIVLVDFWAPWCGPCKMLGPVLEGLDEELGDQVAIKKVNTDENRSMLTRFDIMGIPTMILFKNGEIAETKVGAAPKSALKGWLEGAL